MSLQYTTREATEADAASVHAIHQACIHEICSAFYGKAQIDTWSKRSTPESFVKHIAHKDSVFIVAETKDTKEVIGFCHFGKCNDSRFSSQVDYETYGFYISPSYGRKGVGRTLMAKGEQKAMEMGCTGRMGVVATLNAVPFYEACGYVVTKDGTHCMEGSCDGLACKIMEKHIG